MTTQTAAAPRQVPGLSAVPGASGAGRTNELGHAAEDEDDVARMVAAVGALIEWQGAFLVDQTLSAVRQSVVVRGWSAAGAEPPSTTSSWLWQLETVGWHRRRTWWRDADSRPGSSAFVAVPVWVGDEIQGYLCFYGPSLQQPNVVATDLLEAIAGMVSRELARTGKTVAGSPRDDVLERAIALVDVFAYTVRVDEGGASHWRYLGPNSDAIFGAAVSPDESLISLVERHAHPEDEEAVRDFARALTEGRALDVEIRVIGSDDVVRWTSWRTAPRTSDGIRYVDGVATDVSARRHLEEVRPEVPRGGLGSDELRQHARVVRDANDNVLQRLFAAGLRLQMLKRKLSDAEAHAVSAIAFQLDQAATDLREVIIDLTAVADGQPT